MGLSKFILKTFKWNFVSPFLEEKKCIVIVAPHTSNMDFIIGKMFFNLQRVKAHFLIKKEFFFFPLGWILRGLGAIPIDRSKPAFYIRDLVDIFNKKDCFVLTITPEGTRKPAASWKKGFLMIAEQANVPIIIGYLDYKKKESGYLDYIYPEDFKNITMRKIKDYYKDISGRFPEKFRCD